MFVQEFSKKHGVFSLSSGYSGIFQASVAEVRVTTVTLKQSCLKHLGIQEELGKGIFLHRHPHHSSHAWMSSFKNIPILQKYQWFCDFCLFFTWTFATRILRAKDCLLIPYLYSTHWLWTEASKGAVSVPLARHFFSPVGPESLSKKVTINYIYFLSKDIY